MVTKKKPSPKALVALPKISVADYVGNQLELCGKTQTEVSIMCGFKRPQMIYMIKSGACGVPLEKVTVLARALNVDPIFFTRMVLNEYNPTLLTALESAMNQPILSENELSIIMEIREMNPSDPGFKTTSETTFESQKKKLQAFVSSLG